MDNTLIVTNIERSAIHDGPGLRTVVFLQGCPLRCFWCCNPETQSVRPALLHDKAKCMGCGGCAAVCKSKAVSMNEGVAHVDRSVCKGCGGCVDICPAGANTLSGSAMTVDEVLYAVERDRAYYDATGGGLTLSGGEPLLQDNAISLLRAAKKSGVSTAVETTACLGRERIEAALPYTDMFFVDYKHPDGDALYSGTGGIKTLIEENIRRIALSGKAITLRTPVIPGYNFSEDTIGRCFAFAKSLGMEEYVLLPYHSFGRGKYKKLDMDYTGPDIPALEAGELAPYVKIGADMGLNVRIGG